MKHDKRFDEKAMLYYFGELSVTDSHDFESHLNSCSQCQAELAKLQEMGNILAAIPDKSPSDELVKRANLRVMEVINQEKKASSASTLKSFLNDLAESLKQFMARPQLQLATVSATFLIGILIGKIWLSSGLQNDPELLISFLNHQPEMTQEQQDRVRNAFANYMIQSGDIEMSELAQGNGESEDGIIQVNFKIEKDFALKGGLDNPAILNSLRYSALHENEKERRLRAVNLLSNAMYSQDIEETLISVLLHDQDEEIRLKAMNSLGKKSSSDECKDAFKTVVLNDTSSTIRKEGLLRLKAIGTKDILPIFALTSARDKDPEVKSLATEFLEELDNDKN